MARIADNTGYLKIGSWVVDAEFISCKISDSNKSQTVTSGFGTAHEQRLPGLDDTSIDIEIQGMTDTQTTYLAALKRGQVVTIEWGVNGNTSGYPRHVQTFNLTKVEHGKDVEKSRLTYKIAGEGAAAPTVDQFNGGVYS